jgi:DNA-binding NarL/FixJ family response regulator
MSSNKPVRVLIVEDHQIVADGLTALLNGQKDMTVVGNIGSVAESAAKAAEVLPDIVLLDFRLNDGTGADAAAAIRRVAPNAKHIFLTREDSDVARFAALESGASGFIHKSRAAAEVVDAIRKVAAGGTLITPSAIATLINRRRQMDSQRESLTAREKEVLRLMAEGVSSRDIASKLGI